MKTITEESLDFKTFERNLFKIMCQIACGLIREYLLIRDNVICTLRDKQRYRYIDKNRESTIKSLFGEIRFKRRYYYDKELNKYVFLLDETLGIDSGYGLVSENLAEQMVNEATDKSFRKAAGTINNFTGQHISAQGLWNVVQKFAEQIKQQESRLSELYDCGITGQLGNVSTPVLFVEHDEIWISRQREQRRAPGTVVKGAKMIGKKVGKKPICAGTAYIGWSEPKGGRHKVESKLTYASFEKSSAFLEKFEMLLNHCFDMDGVQQRITNGDGEGWIRTAAENNDSILQLNPFHRSKSIVKAVGDKEDRSILFEAIKEKDVDKTLETICNLILKAPDEKSQKKLVELYNYFYNNMDSFLTWQERDIKLPTPPKGITYREMGVQESNNSLYAQRMKHRKGSWSDNGGDNMARILSYRNSIGFDTILGTLPEPEPIVDICADPLSATQSPKHDGKGYGANWLYAPMPFENTFKTNGRKAIRGMLRQHPLSLRTSV